MNRILIPMDFSEVADNAARYALHMAKSTNSEFVFFHSGKGNDINKLKDQVMHAIPDIELYNARVRYICANDDFTTELVEKTVAMHNISLIVMGTHGQNTPLPPQLFGSNTAAIIESVKVPVIAVPPSFAFNGIKHIAYAADQNYLYKELELVVEFAKTVGAAIDIVHVSPVFPDIGDAEKTNVNEVIERVKEKCGFPYIKYFKEETKRDNQVEKGIHQFIQEHSPDILAMFHISRSWIDKIISPSNAVHELWHIKIPVIVFPKQV